MSKTDAIRAMKLARLESQRAAAPATPAAAPGDLVPESLCGHTAISGRRCTRPQGHAEKNHRYAA